MSEVGSRNWSRLRACTNDGSACSSWYMPSSVTPSDPFMARNVPHSWTTRPVGVDEAAISAVAATASRRVSFVRMAVGRGTRHVSSLVRSRLFYGIDDQRLDGAAAWLQLQSQLFADGGEEGNRV